MGLGRSEVSEVVGALGPEVAEFDCAQAYETGPLRSRAHAKNLSLSLGDRGCMTLATRLGLPVLTAERAWAELTLPVEVRVIRQPYSPSPANLLTVSRTLRLRVSARLASVIHRAYSLRWV